MAIGLGLTLGPVFGSLLFAWIGYVNTFYVFTGFIFIQSTICMFLVPKAINNLKQDDQAFELSYFTLMKERKALSAIIMCVFVMMCNLYVDPILAVRLQEMGMN